MVSPFSHFHTVWRRFSQTLSGPLTKGDDVATHLANPYLQVDTAELTSWIDDYIWTQLFWQTEVHQRMLSEVPKLMVRESHSVEMSKCIYTG